MHADSHANRPVTAVIINYNGRRFLDELLRSLDSQTISDIPVLLIDNASTDGSVSYVRENFPAVRVEPQSRNLGFAEAGNLGVRLSRTPYVSILNTDIRLESQWLEEMIAAARVSSDIAGVASKIRLYGQPGHINGVGGQMNRLGYTWDRGMFEEDRGQFDEPVEVLFASAGAALFRRDVFLEAGGFDERFFMYHEDVDLCWRLWLLGHRIVTAPRAVAYHHFGGSTKESRGLLWREVTGERNNIRALIKNYELPNLTRALGELLLLRQPVRRKAYQLRNFLWNTLYLPETLILRRKIQTHRQRRDKELQHLIVQSTNVPIRL